MTVVRQGSVTSLAGRRVMLEPRPDLTRATSNVTSPRHGVTYPKYEQRDQSTARRDLPELRTTWPVHGWTYRDVTYPNHEQCDQYTGESFTTWPTRPESYELRDQSTGEPITTWLTYSSREQRDQTTGEPITTWPTRATSNVTSPPVNLSFRSLPDLICKKRDQFMGELWKCNWYHKTFHYKQVLDKLSKFEHKLTDAEWRNVIFQSIPIAALWQRWLIWLVVLYQQDLQLAVLYHRYKALNVTKPLKYSCFLC